jgi:hypothetical protein
LSVAESTSPPRVGRPMSAVSTRNPVSDAHLVAASVTIVRAGSEAGAAAGEGPWSIPRHDAVSAARGQSPLIWPNARDLS